MVEMPGCRMPSLHNIPDVVQEVDLFFFCTHQFAGFFLILFNVIKRVKISTTTKFLPLIKERLSQSPYLLKVHQVSA